jgi:hypothetical protein
MPTHAWVGFVHSWHTLGIVLKWMCITVVGIPFAIATCLLIGICALLFAALALAAAAAALAAVFYILKFAWWLLSSTPYWIRDWRIRRAERKLLVRFPTLPTREIRHISAPIGIPPWQPLFIAEEPQVDALSMSTARSAPELRPPPPVHTCVDHRPPTPQAAGPATLLPPLTSAECHVCFEEKDVSEYPIRSPTDGCHHFRTACCTDCLTQSITSSFEGNIWDDIRCPICGNQLQHKDVAEFATPEIFQRCVVSFFVILTHLTPYTDTTPSPSAVPSNAKSQISVGVSHLLVPQEKNTSLPPPHPRHAALALSSPVTFTT